MYLLQHLPASLTCCPPAPSAPLLPSLRSLASSAFHLAISRRLGYSSVVSRNARRNTLFPCSRRIARLVGARASGELRGDVDAIIARGREAGAFVEHCTCVVAGAADGPLHRLTFGVKDMYDVAGFPTGFGNPTWLGTHGIPDTTAPVVQALLAAGATLVGKTAMDELAFSLAGENAHYGTPTNPTAPDRIPGGSSSGSAAAVAAGLVDFALGSDTAGSVRIPANHCGIFGIRTTHGRLPLAGAQPLQPSMDAVGWFAREATVLQRVGSMLFHSLSLASSSSAPSSSSSSSSSSCSSSSSSSFSSLQPFTGWLVAKDAFELADEDAARAIYDKISPHTDAIAAALGGRPEEVAVAGEVGSELGGVHEWVEAMRVLQLIEAWQCHGQWITSHRPAFGPGVAQRFQAASQVDPAGDEVACAQRKRARFTSHVQSLVSGGKLLMLPAAPSIAPLKSAPPADVDSFRVRTLALTVIGGAAGLPQITLPLTTLHGCPLGLGIVAGRGRDEDLLAAAVTLAAILGL
ncbi:hypothetical protein CLOM_g1370 [Closterium sp. NIES-68]|nr:hypothetical protein CLOM_g1370 [Closterium sp. NIES-68]GJP77333.1 hypothetical protein CLOP_g7744 [Closterium sp. NIES-67]